MNKTFITLLAITVFPALFTTHCFATCAQTLATCEQLASEVNVFPRYTNCVECDYFCLEVAPQVCMEDPESKARAAKLGASCQKDCGFK